MQKSASLKNYWTRALLLFTMVFSLMLQSCVDEDDLELPEPGEEIEYDQSVGVISLLRAIERGNLTDENDCFELFFPINLQFNNDIPITISDFGGLIDVANSVNSDLFINRIEFPITISKIGTTKDLNNEQELVEALDFCEIPTLRDEFDHFYTQCFDFQYPIQMVSSANDTVTINSKGEYFEFEFIQGFDKQPQFIYPLTVDYYNDRADRVINNAFELFVAFDECNKCPNLSFDYEILEGTTYEFVADFEEIDEISGFDWWVDGEFIERDGRDVQGDNELIKTFESGFHEVCIKVASEEDDCVAGVEYCKTFEVEDPCPFLFFEYDQINNFTYLFEAAFEAKDEIEYSWVIIHNDDLIYFEEEGPDGDDRLEFQFEPGDYKVCIEAEPEGCPQALKFCEEITVTQ